MIPFIIIENMLRAARESGKVSDEELNEGMLKLVTRALIALVVFLVISILFDPQFCFRREFMELLNTVKNLDI